MAAQPPHPPSDSAGQDPEREPGRGAISAWRQLSAGAWRWLRARPGWLQLLLWLAAWPAAAAVYVGKSRRLGSLAPPLTVAVLLLGGPMWWSVMTGDTPARTAAEATQGWAAPVTLGFGSAAFADVKPSPSELPEFDPGTLVMDIVECVQTRSRSTVREGTIRQPRMRLRVTNHGPERTVVLKGGVLLEGYPWNEGWKPTAPASLELGRGQTAEVTLLTDYRHQASYSPDGLHACRIIDLQVVAPQVWPEHPARQVLPVEAQVVPGAERDFDPQRDLLRPDTR